MPSPLINSEIPIGRFAPSPTGELHLGSLTTALASYCHIKSLGGRWLLRMEDTDTQRCKPEFSQQILRDLDHLGLHHDGEVIYQSQRQAIYDDYLHDKLADTAYACECSRKALAGFNVYPRFCLGKGLTWIGHKIRVQLPDRDVTFLDNLQGWQSVNPQQTLGDVVLKRADGIINYFLAVSVDDGLQGVTHIMRGLDILPLTTAQIALMDMLDLPAVRSWHHLPLVQNAYGQKLSKQNLAQPIDTGSVQKCQALIQHGLGLLKQPPVEMDTPERMLVQAVVQWDETPLKGQAVLGRTG